MTKWIAFPAAALLFAAAWSRPAHEAPFVRRPAPPRIEVPPLEPPPDAPAPADFLDSLAHALLPSTSAAAASGWPPHRNAVWAEVARILEEAYAAIYDERYLRAVGACEEVLRIDPDYAVAGELRTLAQRLQHIKIGDTDSIYRAIEPWVVRTNEDPARPSIPYPETFRLPGTGEWATLRSSPSEARGDPVTEAMYRKLETMKIDLDCENMKLEDILEVIRDFSGLNIILDAAVRDHVDPDQAVTFKVEGLVLKNVLKLLLAQFQLDYFVTEEKVVLLSDYKRPGRPIAATALDSALVYFDIQNAPLTYYLEILRQQTQVEFRLHQEADEMISLRAVGRPLREVLDRLLGPRNLSYAASDARVDIRSDRDPDRY